MSTLQLTRQETLDSSVARTRRGPRRDLCGVAREAGDGWMRVAKGPEEILTAWQIVYHVYLHSGLILANPFCVHTMPQVVSNRSAVFLSGSGDEIESTLTGVLDGGQGLPVDAVYHKELNALRREGRRLMECGLFAHRWQVQPVGERAAREGQEEVSASQQLRRISQSLTGLMRLCFYFGLTHGVTDFIIGVHPRHAAFYRRAFGFRQEGPERSYETVNNRPVVLLRGDLREQIKQNPMPAALSHCLENPVDTSDFASRFRFASTHPNPALLPVDMFLRYKYSRWNWRGKEQRKVV